MAMANILVLLCCWFLAFGMFALAIFAPFYLLEYQMLFVAMGIGFLVASVLVIWKMR